MGTPLYPSLQSVKKVLVMTFRHHGDVLLSSPVFSNLKLALPEAQIDALVFKETAPMLEGHPAISEVITYDKGKGLSKWQKLKREFALFKEIKNRSYDLVIALTGGDRSAFLSAYSQAPIRVGFSGRKSNFIYKKAYTHTVHPCPTIRHTVERYLDALRRIGIFPKPSEKSGSIFISDETRSKCLSLLKSNDIQEKEYILIHPASRWLFKCLTPLQMGSVMKELKRYGKKIILTSAPDKEELLMLQEIESHCQADLNLGGKISLKELACFIDLSEVLLCVDSVPLHMASCLKKPVAVLFGPSCDKTWGPWMNPLSLVISLPYSCRPCNIDGCGGSKKSDCLHSILPADIVKDVLHLTLAE